MFDHHNLDRGKDKCMGVLQCLSDHPLIAMGIVLNHYALSVKHDA